VLIQVKSERWSGDFRAETSKLPRAKALVQHGVTAANESLAAMQPKIGEMRRDPVAQLLWMRTGVSGAQTQILSGVHLTSEGSIQVHCSAPAADFDKLAPVCPDIIQSVRIDENARYRPRSMARIFVEDHPAVTAIGPHRHGVLDRSGAAGTQEAAERRYRLLACSCLRPARRMFSTARLPSWQAYSYKRYSGSRLSGIDTFQGLV
jgi:hypothetical protein